MATQTEASVKERFLSDVSKHTMQVLRDDGLYRHLRFSNDGSSVMQFDLLTWPGYLCYCGDMGTFVFRRTEDMFRFFRRGDGAINPSYWSEKVDACGRGGVLEFDPEVAKREVREWAQDFDAALKQEVEDEVIAACDEGEHSLRRAIEEFNHDHDFAFLDFWECGLDSYTYRFLWCCHALVYGVQRYDEMKNWPPAPPASEDGR